MKVDTRIRHVTKPGANLFVELGFSPAESKRLQVALRQHVHDTVRVKPKARGFRLVAKPR